MPLLNYTTSIDVHKTLGEIQKQLVSHGARKIMYDYEDDGHILSLCFQIETSKGLRGIRLPANVPVIHKVLINQKKAGKIKTNPDYDQAERVAWRIVKDWVEAQMAILEAQMVQIDEIFLPYMVDSSGMTFFQMYQRDLITDGDGAGPGIE